MRLATVSPVRVGLVLAAVLAACPAPAHAQEDKIVKRVTTQMLERVLDDMNIQYKKVPGNKGVFFYDYTRNNFKLRLHFYDGKDLMIDALFTNSVPLESINDWNVKSRFSRALILKQKNVATTTLDSNLDCLGGVCEGTISQFIRTFDQEVKAFSNFLNAVEVVEESYNQVTRERIEKNLDSLGVKFPKVTAAKDMTHFEFVRNGQTIVLTSFAGKDIQLSAKFANKTTVDALNKYNLKRSFIRAVMRKQDGKSVASLEANLDCAGGCTDGILRNWIVIFDSEIIAFNKYLKEEQ